MTDDPTSHPDHITGELPIVHVTPDRPPSRWKLLALAFMALAALALIYRVGIWTHDVVQLQHDSNVETRCARERAAENAVAQANVLATQSQIINALIAGRRDDIPSLASTFAEQTLTAKDAAMAYSSAVTRCQR